MILCKLFGYFYKIYIEINKRKIIDFLPTIDLKTNDERLSRNEDKIDCSICLTYIDVGKQLHCGHIFHESCLEEYLLENMNLKCPVCGFIIQYKSIDFQELKKKHPLHLQVISKDFHLINNVSKRKLKKLEISKPIRSQNDRLIDFFRNNITDEEGEISKILFEITF